MKYGLGGRLITPITTLLLSIIPITTFSYYLETNFVLTMISLTFCGFFMVFSRAGSMTFAIEMRPDSPASVSCAFSCSQFILSFICVTAAVYLHSKIGLIWFALPCSIPLLFFGIAIIYLARPHWVSYSIVNRTEEEIKMENLEEVVVDVENKNFEK
jgi:hypothetical protein